MISFESKVNNLKLLQAHTQPTPDTIVQLQRSFLRLREQLFSTKSPFPQPHLLKLINLIKDTYLISIRTLLSSNLTRYNEDVVFEMGLKVKIVCSELIMLLIEYLSDHSDLLRIVSSHSLYLNAFEILVITGRMCLDVGAKYAIFAKKVNQHAKLISTNNVLGEDQRLMFLYLLNDLELLRYEGDKEVNESVVLEKVQRLEVANFPDYQAKYQEYIKYILLNVAVKLLKKGYTVEGLYSYLPEKELYVIKGLYSVEDFNYKEAAHLVGITSAYYELYLEVRHNGFTNISEECLKEVLVKNWQSSGFFETLAEKYEESATPLRLWFSVYNSTYSKTTPLNILSNALKFFASIVDYWLEKVISVALSALLDLVKEIFNSILNAKKSLELSMTPFIQRIVLLIRAAVVEPGILESEVRLLFENTRKAIQKHSYPQIQKDLLSIFLFYLFSHDSPDLGQYYNAYIEEYPEQSQLKRAFTIAYENRATQELSPTAIQLIKEEPLYINLFLTTKGLKSAMFLPPSTLDAFTNVFSLFTQILQTSNQLQIVAQRLICYLDEANFVVAEGIEQDMNQLIAALVVESQSEQLGAETKDVLVFCAFCCEAVRISKRHGLVEKVMRQNKYYKLSLCLEQIIKINQPFKTLCQLGVAVMTAGLSKALTQSNQSSPAFEVGQFQFYELVYSLLSSPPNKTSESLTSKMVMFHLRSLHNDIDTLLFEVKHQNNPSLLNLYNTCPVLPTKVRVHLVRKIMFLGLSLDQEYSVSLDHLKTVVLHGDDVQERVLCAKQMVMVYGAEGREFLQMMAERFPEVKNVIMMIST